MSTTNLNKLKVVLVDQNKISKCLTKQLGKFTCSVREWYQSLVRFVDTRKHIKVI